MDYTWKVESVDNASNTMVVQYTYDNQSISLNLPKPAGELVEHIKLFAPIDTWKMMKMQTAEVQVGQAGSCSYVEQSPPTVLPEMPTMIGSIDEEYLRALIFQVIEEIEASRNA